MKYQPYQHIEVTINEMTLTRPAPKRKKPIRCRLGNHTTYEFELTDKQMDQFIAGQYPRYCAYCSHTLQGIAVPHISERTFDE